MNFHIYRAEACNRSDLEVNVFGSSFLGRLATVMNAFHSNAPDQQAGKGSAFMEVLTFVDHQLIRRF